MSWQIHIERLATQGIIGVDAWERVTPQQLFITLRMTADLNAAAKEDNVNLTVDYGKVADFTRNLVSQCEPKLIEHLAKRIADAVLDAFGLTAIEVQIDKPDAVTGNGNICVRYQRLA